MTRHNLRLRFQLNYILQQLFSIIQQLQLFCTANLKLTNNSATIVQTSSSHAHCMSNFDQQPYKIDFMVLMPCMLGNCKSVECSKLNSYGCQFSSHLSHKSLQIHLILYNYDTISLFRGLWVFTLVRILPKLSTVLNTDVVPNQDPPDLV